MAEAVSEERLDEVWHLSHLASILRETEWQVNRDLGSHWLADQLYRRGARVPLGHEHVFGIRQEDSRGQIPQDPVGGTHAHLRVELVPGGSVSDKRQCIYVRVGPRVGYRVVAWRAQCRRTASEGSDYCWQHQTPTGLHDVRSLHRG